MMGNGVEAMTEPEAASAGRAGGPRLSIGMPVRNGERYIRQALDALLAQSLGDFELTICDNASTDGTRAICEEYVRRDRRVRYLPAARNAGLQANFARALDAAGAPYFMWACHDDLWDRTYVERMVAILDARPEVVLAASNAASVDQRGVRRREYDHGRVAGPGSAFSRALRFVRADPAGAHAMLIYGVMRTAAIKRVGYQPLRPLRENDRDLALDKLTLFRLIFEGDLVVVPEVLYFHRDEVAPPAALSPARRRRHVRWVLQNVGDCHRYFGDLRHLVAEAGLDRDRRAVLEAASVARELLVYPELGWRVAVAVLRRALLRPGPAR